MISRSLSLALLVTAAATARAQQGGEDATVVWAGRIAAGATLEITNFNGPIAITGASGDRAEVRARKIMRGRDPQDVSFDVREANGGVSICSAYRGRSACGGRGVESESVSIRFEISLPAGARLVAGTGNGEISVDRTGADVEIRSGNGDLRIGQAGGRVTASTGNGEIDIDRADGPVRANTGNGRIDVTTSAGPVSAHTGNGSIDVRMTTLSAPQDMEFTSGSGSIRVTLPANFNGSFDGSTGNGELQSDFPIQMVGRLDPQHMRGTIGSGGPQIRMRTGNGRLELRRAS